MAIFHTTTGSGAISKSPSVPFEVSPTETEVTFELYLNLTICLQSPFPGFCNPRDTYKSGFFLTAFS